MHPIPIDTIDNLLQPVPNSLKSTKNIPPFSEPFHGELHPLAVSAAQHLQQRLEKKTKEMPSIFSSLQSQEGKMFGVLVVEYNNQLYYLSAFEGSLTHDANNKEHTQWICHHFVPPVFDIDERKRINQYYQTQISQAEQHKETEIKQSEKQQLQLQLHTDNEEYQARYDALKKQYITNKKNRNQQRLATPQSAPLLAQQSQSEQRKIKQLKQAWKHHQQHLQEKIQDITTALDNKQEQIKALHHDWQTTCFNQYNLLNYLGEKKNIHSLFDNIPPSGSGDCCAPKLLQSAYQLQLQPLAYTEFWWGAAPKIGIRQHQQFYPPCRGRCAALLPFMLKGVSHVTPRMPSPIIEKSIEILFEDKDCLVINKPAGLLSVPGHDPTADNVYNRIKAAYPLSTGSLLVHRLDMMTSGILLIAKNAIAHKFLQQQFIHRQIKKRYVAKLIHQPADQNHPHKTKGEITLPLCLDPYDRPRQTVSQKYGRAAHTHWQWLCNEGEGCRVYFYPITGRTHQLRMHAAHYKGMNNPILGDRLYGGVSLEQKNNTPRLMLHAESIYFRLPNNTRTIYVQSHTPF